MNTIALCGGGTAGHVIPAVALLPSLKKHFDNIVFIGGKKGIETDIAQNLGLDYYGVTSCKLARSLTPQNLAIPYCVIKGVIEAKKILKKLRPRCLFSKGGYVSLPVVIAAAMLKIPVIAHESDLTPGIANKIGSRFCAAVCTSFDQCKNKFKKGVYTGSPIREELFCGNKENILKNFKHTKPVLLITGGSSGAAFINNMSEKCYDILLKDYNIIHITGKGNMTKIQTAGYMQLEFCHNMADIFAATDYVVSRAGSNTLFELMLLKKPSLIIPLPKAASRGDQIQNALYFEQKGCIAIALQEYLSSQSFTQKVLELKSKRLELIQNINKSGIICGNKKITEVILNFCN